MIYCVKSFVYNNTYFLLSHTSIHQWKDRTLVQCKFPTIITLFINTLYFQQCYIFMQREILHAQEVTMQFVFVSFLLRNVSNLSKVHMDNFYFILVNISCIQLYWLTSLLACLSYYILGKFLRLDFHFLQTSRSC